MPAYNRVTLIGNITRDPDLRYTPKGTAVVQFGLAINHNWTDDGGQKREDVCFVDIAGFGKPAETVAQYCKKGKLLLVEGRLKQDTWDDKQTGQKRSKLEVVMENFQFLSYDADAQPTAPETRQRQPELPQEPQSGPSSSSDDDVPF